MSVTVIFENALLPSIKLHNNSVADLNRRISEETGLDCEDFYLTLNGKLLKDDFSSENIKTIVRAHARLLGGKGGFGSMLRAIGAQIEKTTNREACRDLSGRRLRDINEEKRLRKWLEGQADREKEAAERKQKKLERLTADPSIVVKLDDPVYENERQALPERVSAAVDAGWQASTSNTLKRKADEPKPAKKKKLWIDADLSDCSSGSDDEDEGVSKEIDSPQQLSPTVAVTDSGNESDRASTSSKI